MQGFPLAFLHSPDSAPGKSRENQANTYITITDIHLINHQIECYLRSLYDVTPPKKRKKCVQSYPETPILSLKIIR